MTKATIPVILDRSDIRRAEYLATHDELLSALVNLQKQIHAHHKMNVKKDFSLMVADAQANKAIALAQAKG